MTFGIGGYRVGNGRIHLQSTKNPSKAAGILAKTGNLDYIAAHGSAQISQDGKQIYTMVESLRRPISAFIKSLFYFNT